MCEDNKMRRIDTTLYFITDSTGWDEDEFLRRVELALNPRSYPLP